MPKTQKMNRSKTSKMTKEIRPEIAEPVLGSFGSNFPQTLAGILKPLPAGDNTLIRLIERIKNL